MNDFLKLILQELKNGLIFAIIAVVICAAIFQTAFLVFKGKYKNDRKFPWLKASLLLILAGWATALLYVTVLRVTSYGYSSVNLHLFRAWHEAWNHYAFKNWMNVLLNVAMFVPLGILLPIVLKRFRKWYLMLTVSIAATFAIEIIQYFSGRGIFDVDDLAANTLGAMIGFCIIMIYFSFREKKGTKPFAAYAALPILSLLLFAGTVVVYNVQPYGNLEDAAAYPVNVRNIEWQLNCDLMDADDAAQVYRAEMYDKESCDAFAEAFFERIGVKMQDISYYDKETWYANHSTPAHFLVVSHLDRSYKYTYVDTASSKMIWTETDEEIIKKLLASLGVEIPKGAEFAYEGDGWHCFSIEHMLDGETMIDGSARCRYSASGKLREVDNNISSYALCKNEAIISAQEAYQQIRNGKFNGEWIEHYEPDVVEVVSCELDYQIDTKGYLQPVYIFGLKMEAEGNIYTAMIPALK